jgi:hypothetical protein
MDYKTSLPGLKGRLQPASRRAGKTFGRLDDTVLRHILSFLYLEEAYWMTQSTKMFRERCRSIMPREGHCLKVYNGMCKKLMAMGIRVLTALIYVHDSRENYLSDRTQVCVVQTRDYPRLPSQTTVVDMRRRAKTDIFLLPRGYKDKRGIPRCQALESIGVFICSCGMDPKWLIPQKGVDPHDTDRACRLLFWFLKYSDHFRTPAWMIEWGLQLGANATSM